MWAASRILARPRWQDGVYRMGASMGEDDADFNQQDGGHSVTGDDFL